MTGIFLNVLALSISMAPIIAALLILSPLISKKYSSILQYWIWLVITVRLLIPFSPAEGFRLISEIPFIKWLTLENPVAGTVSSINDSLVQVTVSVETTLMLKTLEVIAAVYFTGFIIFLLYKVSCYLYFIKSIRGDYRGPSQRTVDAALELSRRIGIKIRADKPSIYICRKIPGPMVVGVVKPVLLLPNESYDEIKLRMILSHEMVHMKRNDTLFKLLLMIASAMHWFNPLIHMMSRRACRDIEVSCDTIALNGADHDQKKIYGFMILDMAAPRSDIRFSSFLTSFGTEKENLEIRINNIFSSTKKKKGYVALIVVMFAVLFFSAAMQINHPTSYAEEAGKAVNAEESQDVKNSNITEDLGNMGTAPGVTGINDSINEGNIQEKGNGNNYNENNPGSNGAGAVSSQIADESSHGLSEPAEIVVIDLNQLN